MTTPTTGTLRSLVAIPKPFNSNKITYPTWKQQVKLYVKANEAQLPNNKSKQLIALSYMQDGKASCWANAAIDHMLAGTFRQNVTTAAVAATATTSAQPAATTLVTFTWDQFWGLADNVFNPPDVQNDAAMKLENLRQGSLAAKVYFIKFNMQAILAGYDDSTFDTMKIRLANQQLNKALIDNIHNTASLPTAWQDYKDQATALDRNFRTGRVARANKLGQSTLFSPQQQQQPITTPRLLG
jgi:hypothetical protein